MDQPSTAAPTGHPPWPAPWPAAPRAKKTIVIVGGGFAGTTLALALQGRLPADHELLLISEESYTTFNPMLAEVVGGMVATTGHHKGVALLFGLPLTGLPAWHAERTAVMSAARQPTHGITSSRT